MNTCQSLFQTILRVGAFCRLVLLSHLSMLPFEQRGEGVEPNLLRPLESVHLTENAIPHTDNCEPQKLS